MKSTSRFIAGGAVFILALAVAVFATLTMFMNSETEKDVRKVAEVQLSGISRELLHTFESITEIRQGQIDNLIDEVASTGSSSDYETFSKKISEICDFQNLTAIALVSSDGNIVTVSGDKMISVDNLDIVMTMFRNNERIVTAGQTEKVGQVIVYGRRCEYPMPNGGKSLGILCVRYISMFSKMMNLTDNSSIIYKHIIRPDGTYVIKNDDSVGEAFFDKILTCATPFDMTAEEAVARMKRAMETDQEFSMSVTYNNPDQGVNERRSVLAVPMDHGDWYIVVVMPYRVLDTTIESMGTSRSNAMFVSVGVLSVGILGVFAIYFRMSQHQMKELALAKENSERLMEEAEEAKQEAEDSRDEAVRAKTEAEESREEAIAAQAEAVRSKEEAEQAREEAEQANKAKSDFLSNMSHDIRTPMNAIVGMTVIAEDHAENPEQVKECLRKINISSKQLLGLINDILDMSKIESGKMTLSPELISLRETMETMCDIIRPQIKMKNQEFEILISNIISEEVFCDGVRLNQILINLLGNAVKFTPDYGTVTLSLSQEQSAIADNIVRCHLYVRDTGIGMSDEFKKKLFTAFEHEDSKRVHRTEGSGLGMAITKYIVDAMHGTIEVNTELGKGTEFHIILDLEKGSSSKEMRLPDWNVLIADDDPDLCDTAATSLKDIGVNVVTVNGGEDAVEKIIKQYKDKKGFNVALIDYKMDGINGIETVRRIREAVGDSLPVILISAYDWTEFEDEARAAGATGFIAKPLFKSTLYHELSKYVGHQIAESPASVPEKKKVDLTGMRILLAEDIEINAQIAAMLLKKNGARVEHAEDGKIAADMFAKSEPGYYNLILMDLRMPNMNGYEATRAIRGMDRPDAKKIPIIAMTADAFADDVQNCLDAGMDAHVAKPIDLDTLLKTLSKFI